MVRTRTRSARQTVCEEYTVDKENDAPQITKKTITEKKSSASGGVQKKKTTKGSSKKVLKELTKKELKEREDRKQSLIEELELEVANRAQQMRKKAEELKSKLQLTFNVEMLSLPPKIRKMKVGDFVAEYGGALDQVIEADCQDIEEAWIAQTPLKTPGTAKRKAAPEAAPTPRSTKRQTRSIAQTPGATPRATPGPTPRTTRGRAMPVLPDMTTPRTTRRSARLASQTPQQEVPRFDSRLPETPALATPSTRASINLGAKARLTIDTTKDVTLNVESDEGAVDLANIQSLLTGESKEEARNKLLALQNQISAIMDQI